MNHENAELLMQCVLDDYGGTYCGMSHTMKLLLASSKETTARQWVRMTQQHAERLEKEHRGVEWTAREVLSAALMVADYYDTQTEEAA